MIGKELRRVKLIETITMNDGSTKKVEKDFTSLKALYKAMLKSVVPSRFFYELKKYNKTEFEFDGMLRELEIVEIIKQ